MRKLIALIALFVIVKNSAQDLTIIHINAKWNEKNNYRYIEDIEGATIQFGYLENQPDQIKSSIKSVPTIILMKEGRPVYIWNADISLKIKVSLNEIQNIVNQHRFVRRRTSLETN
jgi:hypothetical protein